MHSLFSYIATQPHLRKRIVNYLQKFKISDLRTILDERLDNAIKNNNITIVCHISDEIDDAIKNHDINTLCDWQLLNPQMLAWKDTYTSPNSWHYDSRWITDEGRIIANQLKISARVARNGWLEGLQWLREHNCAWNELVCINAAYYGHINILKWAHENGCPWSGATCIFATKGGQLDTLKWLRANDCPWGDEICMYAAEIGRLDILQWAHENGCLCSASAYMFAAENGHLNILEYLINHHIPPDNTDFCARAAYSGQLTILQWLRANGCPWDDNTRALASKYGHPEVEQWAAENGCEWNKDMYKYDDPEWDWLPFDWMNDHWCCWSERIARLSVRSTGVITWLDNMTNDVYGFDRIKYRIIA